MSETAGLVFLQGLRRAGIDCVYAIAGTDFAPLIEAWADPDLPADSVPRPVLVAHESVAVGMAHGAWLATGRPQAVAVHVSVGTANAVCAVMNAAKDRMPLVFMAGRTPLTEQGQHGSRNVHIHWGQELFDQGGVVREVVKWDYELRHGNPADAVAARAVAIAAASPSAPVYLSLPREVLAAPAVGDPSPAAPVPTLPRASADAVSQVATLLAGARFPLVITSASGFDPAVPALLGAVADRFGVGVVERIARGMNLADDHPCHLGHRPDALLPHADVVLVLESDVPWFPGGVTPRDDATVVHVGPDPSFARYPLRTHRADLAVTADIASFLSDLVALAPPTTPGRSAMLARYRAEFRRAVATEADADEAAAADAPITKLTLMRALSAAIDDDTIVVNEYPMARDHIARATPGTWLQHSPAAGLGWGLPAALGVQHARPDATVVATLGDGAYLFANPAACHHAAAAHRLPVVTVIATNRRWDAVAWSTLGLYPEGHAASAGNAMPLVSLEPVPEFVRYCEASGGWGVRVDTRNQLAPALAEALRVARVERRQALVDVRCA